MCEYEAEFRNQVDGYKLADSIKQTSDILNRTVIVLERKPLQMSTNLTLFENAMSKGTCKHICLKFKTNVKRNLFFL